MRQKKYLLQFMLLVCCLFFLYSFSASAGWIEDKDNKTIIHIKPWKLPDPTSTIPNQRADWEVLKAFVKQFPATFARKYAEKYKANPKKYGKHNWDNVEIQLHKFSGITIEGLDKDSRPLMAIAGGVAPDILYVNFRQSDTYIQNGFLYPLDKPEDEYFTGMTKDEIDYCVHPKIWPVIKRKGPKGEEHIWTKPFGGIEGKVVLYRKDLLDAKKVPYPTNDWTWDDLYNACKKITDPEKGHYGIAFGKGSQESWYWVTYLWSAGGEVMVRDKGTEDWTACFASKAGVEALYFYTKLCSEPWRDKNGTLRFGYALKDNTYDKWNLGMIGFQEAYIDAQLFQQINPDVIGMVAVPKGPGGHRGAEMNSRMQGIFAGIKESAVRDACWEFMLFGGSRAASKIRTDIMVDGGLGRFVNPTYLHEFGYDDIIRLTPKGWMETYNITMKAGQPEPYGKNCQFVYQYMTLPLNEADTLMLKKEIPKNKEKRDKLLMGMLKHAEDIANEKMIGNIPPEKMRMRRIVAVIMLIAIAVSFAMLLHKVIKAFTPPGIEGVKQAKWGFKKYFWAYIMLLPAVLTIIFWQYLPLLLGSKMAFQDYSIMGNSVWVGVDNFAHLLWNENWWNSVWNAVCYSFLIIALTFLPPVILAVLLDEIPYCKIFFRTMFYLPAVITGLVVIYLWKSFYDISDFGVLNQIIMRIPGIGYAAIGTIIMILFFMFARRLYLQQVYLASTLCIIAGICLFIFSLQFVFNIYSQLNLNAGDGVSVAWYSALTSAPPIPYRWLDDPKTALLCCVLPMVWMGMGPGCLIYLAALKGIAPDFYEAADMDGASFIDKILFIIVPSLKPLLIIQFIAVFIASWKSSAFILAMTGMSKHTEVAGLHIFFEAYSRLKFGSATAMAWALGFMLIWFTVRQLKMLSRLEFKTTGNK